MSARVSDTKQEPVLVLNVMGNILSTNAEEIRSSMFADLNKSSARLGCVEIDLSRAAMVDSVGLNLLVSVIKHVKSRSGSIRLLVGSNSVERTFRFTRLDTQAQLVRV